MDSLISLAKNPVPSGARVGLMPGFDGKKLRYALWPASSGPRRGTVCVFPGRTEFIEKYFEVVADLRRRGLAVAIMDWRGQGGSERLLDDPRKGSVQSFDDYERDVVRYMRDIVLPDCPPPYIALGHSMGGHMMLRVASMPGCWFDRMVVVAPLVLLARQALPVSRAMAHVYAEMAGSLGLGKLYVPRGSGKGWQDEPFEGNPLTSDRQRFERNQAVLRAAPELAIGAPTIAWLRAALRSMRLISAPGYGHNVRLPILFILAGEDRVVSTRAAEDFTTEVKIGSHIVIPQASHEILQERDEMRLQFWAAFDAYLDVGR